MNKLNFTTHVYTDACSLGPFIRKINMLCPSLLRYVLKTAGLKAFTGWLPGATRNWHQYNIFEFQFSLNFAEKGVRKPLRGDGAEPRE